MAHNGGRFDSIFLLKYLMTKKSLVPETVMNGNSIISIYIPELNIKIIDSFLFLRMKLAQFPKSLGIKDLTKGYHPYRFTDLSYVGEMISKDYFDIPTNDKEKQKFELWYQQQCLKTYDFRKAVYYYCRLDVDILRQGCTIFAHLIKDITHILPFYDNSCNTIASLALKIYRTNFLKTNVIGQLPPTGYRGNVNQSAIAMCWLEGIGELLDEEGMTLESALSANGEKRILNRPVDGYCKDNNTVYQFHGCFYHGCKKCFNQNELNSVLNETHFKLNKKTARFSSELKRNGYNVVEMWECDYMREKKMKASDIDDKKRIFFKSIPLNPRDALYGGRTSPAKLYYNCDENEKVMYIDFCSLYPYVQKKYEYPVMHPKIFVGDDCNNIGIENVFGLIKCSIIPPRDLLFPVLPVRVNGKLLFPLCNECATTKNQTLQCEHSVEQKIITGVWTSVEIHEAIKQGYKMHEVYEIYHYEKREKIFSDFVNTFIKIKQESSGYPQQCYGENGEISDELVDKFIDAYFVHEGVNLDRNNIIHNPGKRTVIKAILNALWGKLAQNENIATVSFFDDFDDLLDLLNDNTNTVTTLDFITDDIMRTTHRKTSGATVTMGSRNVIIASFVTSYARLELLKLLSKLGARVIYYDTDSVIYITYNDKNDNIETGDYLGDLTDELNAKRDANTSEKWIEHFISTGPKSYSYRTNKYTTLDDNKNVIEKFDEIVHVKGFSLKGDAARKITFESIKKCVFDSNCEIEITYADKISRTNQQEVVVQTEKKKFKFTFDKRVILDDFSTVPYGYCK